MKKAIATKGHEKARKEKPSASASAKKRSHHASKGQAVSNGQDARSTKTFGLRNNAELIGEAFELFSTGLSATKVFEKIRDNWPALTLKTLERIVTDNNWVELRAQNTVLASKAFEGSEKLLPEIILKLKKVKSDLELIKGMSFQEIAQYRGVCEDLLMCTGEHPKLKMVQPFAVSGDLEVQALIETLENHAVLGPLLRKLRPNLESEFQKCLARLKHEKAKQQ